MIAVSQSLVLGTPLAPTRAASGATFATTMEGNAFLQAFVNVGNVDAAPESSHADAGLEREIMPNLPDAPDGEVRVELTPVDGAIWLPVTQVITTLQLPNTGNAKTGKADGGKADTGMADASMADTSMAVTSMADTGKADTGIANTGKAALSAETATGVNSSRATLGTVELEPAKPTLPSPMDQTAGQPLADPTFDCGEGVALQKIPANVHLAATVLSPEGEASKPNTEFDPALQNQDAHTVAKQSPSAPPKFVAADASTATAPEADLPQTYVSLMAEGQFSPSAHRSNTPAEHLKNTYVDTEIVLSASNMPSKIAWPDPRVSNVENAWREKWASDVPGLSDSDTQATVQTVGPAINGVATPTVLFCAPAVFVSDAGQKTTNPAPGHAPLPGTILASLTADQSPKSTLPELEAASDPLPFAIRQDRSIQLADSLLETATSFDAGSFATCAATTPQPAISSFAPLLRSLTPGLPTAVSPILIEMARSGNDGPLELALSPEELGRLTISIKQDGDFVRITVTADRPETLDLMRRHGGDLVADLRQAGFSGASLSFGQGGQGQQPRFANAEPAAKNLPTPQHLPPETKPTASSRFQKGSGVDLRF